MPPSLLWYDLETLGLDPRRNPCIQFGAVRTDADFRTLDTIDILCRPSADYLPSPESVLVHGISPLQLVGEWGRRNKVLRESAFAARIYREVTRPDTCSIGYNSIEFDNAYLRHLFFRNFHPPYDHEYKDGCSKWDLINVFRLVSCVAPDAFKLPRTEDGTPSYTLSALADANNIDTKKHDALEDVRALQAMARLVCKHAPEILCFCYTHRKKRDVLRLLQSKSTSPPALLHFSSHFAGKHHSGSVICPLMQDKTQTNLFHCLDLRYSPQPLLDLSVEEARTRLFTKHDELAKQELTPIGIKGVRVNRCPILHPFVKEWSNENLDAIFARLALARDRTRQHLQLARDNHALLCEKVNAIHAETQPPADDRDQPYRPAEDQLYDQFIPDDDLHHLVALTKRAEQAAPEVLAAIKFKDPRLAEMVLRYKARNCPDQLTETEAKNWQQHQRQIQQRDLPAILRELKNLLNEYDEDTPQRILLLETQTYLQELTTEA